MSGGFEGSYLGDAGKLSGDTRLECGICWWVYDPAEGDDAAQISPGTPFSALPGHWRCPVCDAEKHQFMVIGANASQTGPAADGQKAGESAQEADAARIARLVAAYRSAEERMRDLPVHNPGLVVEAVGFGRVRDGLAGVICTPWCMNLTFLPDQPTGRASGEPVNRTFPSGDYAFIAGDLDGFGPVEIFSLFSPMDDFDDPAAVRLAAQGAMAELLRPPAPAAETPPRDASPAPPSRRALFAVTG